MAQVNANAPNFALIRGGDQWQRAAFNAVALVDGMVQLAWDTLESTATIGDPLTAAGLAFDAHCRLYHSVIARDEGQGNVERILWSAQNPLKLQQSPEPLLLFAATATPLAGDFASTAGEMTALRDPRALAVGHDERLFIADGIARQLVIFDLWSQRLVRRVSLPGEPVDLECDGEWVYVLLANPAGLLRLRAHGAPVGCQLAASITRPSRLLKWSDGRILILNAAGTATARIVNASDGVVLINSDVAAFASDIASYQPSNTSQHLLMIARRGGEDFLRAELNGNSVAFVEPFTARAYDGRGIVRTPDQRIAYWTDKGLRYAVAARLRYARSGSVVSFRLDGGEYQMQWGRVFTDACMPRDSAISLRCVASDELPDSNLIARTPPVNMTALTIEHDELSPPLPAQWMLDKVTDSQLLYRRAQGSELPWLQRASDDEFVTYEAPIIAEAGRYLWLVFELSGTSIVTPRIRSVRAEYPSHDYLRRLPRTFSTEAETAIFLRRFLAMFAGQLKELSERAEQRDILLNPQATAELALPWLASMLGLTLDERWSEESRRTAIAEAIDLFKRRGTIKGLTRFIEIVAGVQPVIIEKYRMRGGGMVGEPNVINSNAVVGAGFRVGGAIGVAESSMTSVGDAFATHAHRFTVLLPGVLDDTEMAMVSDLLELHRPAHTLYDLCSIGAGMRVGRGLHVGISSCIGRSGSFTQLQVSNSALGRGAVVGRPQIGIRPGATHLSGAFDSNGHSRVG